MQIFGIQFLLLKVDKFCFQNFFFHQKNHKFFEKKFGNKIMKLKNDSLNKIKQKQQPLVFLILIKLIQSINSSNFYIDFLITILSRLPKCTLAS